MIVAFLVLQDTKRASRDYLAALLWPGPDQKRQRRSLRQALHVLRTLGADAALSSTDGDLILDPERINADVWQLDDALEKGAYSEAIRLVGGSFLDSVRDKMPVEFARWAEAEDARLEVTVDRVFALAVERWREMGAWEKAISACRSWVSLNPLAEGRVRTLIETLVQAGDPLAALQQAKRFRALIEAELGDTPSAGFVEAERRAETALSRIRSSIEGRHGANQDAMPATCVPSEEDSTLAPRLVATSLIVIAAGVAAGFVFFLFDSEPSIHIPARRGADDGVLTLTPSSVTFESDSAARAMGSVSSPFYSHLARGIPTVSGTDLEVIDSTGARMALLDSPADEFPLDWSPDGRQLLYRRGRYEQTTHGYRVTVGVWDRDSGATHEFEVSGFDGRLMADWSPDGSRIAIGGGPRLVVSTPEGTVQAEIEPGGLVGQPRWSATGRRLAVDVWDGTPADVHLFDPNANGLAPILRTPGDERSVTWLNDRFLLAVSEFDDRTHLVLIDCIDRTMALVQEDVSPLRFTQASRALATDDVVGELYDSYSRISRPTLVDSLHVPVPNDLTRLSEGEYVLYKTTPLGSDGTILAGFPRAPSWTVESGILSPVAPGLFRATAPGRERVSVSYPGWRTTSFTVDISEPRRRSWPIRCTLVRDTPVLRATCRSLRPSRSRT